MVVRKRERILTGVEFSPGERDALRVMAIQDDRSRSSMLRTLIREEAKRRGIQVEETLPEVIDAARLKSA